MGGEATIVLGVTGHRVLPTETGLAARIDGAIDDLAGERAVRLLTSLADGADRLVARRVLARGGGSIEALLPMAATEYEDDFDEASVADFRSLLAVAVGAEVVDCPDADRVAHYEAAGFAVVDRSEALLAVWDGQPARGRGGTAHVVERARRAGRPVRIVAVTR